VRLVLWVCCVEAVEQLDHFSRPFPDQLFEQRSEARLPLRGELGAAGRNPYGRSLAAFDDQHPGVAKRPADQGPPERRVVRLTLERVGKRPASRRIVMKCEADGLGHRGQISQRGRP